MKTGFRRIMALVLCMCLIIQINTGGLAMAHASTEAAAMADEAVITEAAAMDALAGAAYDIAADGAGEAGAKGMRDLSRYEDADYEVAVLYRSGEIKVQDFESSEALVKGLDALDADEEVELYQPNFRYRADAVGFKISDDRYTLAQWYLRNDGTFSGAQFPVKAAAGIDINAEWAWDAYEAKRSVVVAVIDTGIDRWNLDMNGRVWKNAGEIQGNGKDDDGNGYVDDCWGWNFYDNSNIICRGVEDDHGTHCASVIASHAGNGYGIAGIAPYDNIKIMCVKALGGDEGNGTTVDIVNSIKYAEDNGAQICNLSLGTEKDDILLKKEILTSKMLFVAAAGNSTGANIKGKNLDNHANYPAAYTFDNVITVANLAADGRLHTTSDYGPKSVDIAAPGTDIAGATVSDQYVFMTGTSMAAPMVAAAAALVYTASEDMTVIEVKECILDNARQLDSLTGYVGTGGMLDASAAVKCAVIMNGSDDAAGDADDSEGSQTEDNTVGGAVGDDLKTDTGINADADKGTESDGNSVPGTDGDSDDREFEDDGRQEIVLKIPGVKKEITITLPDFMGEVLNKFLNIGRR